MAEALVSLAVEKLGSIVVHELRLVVGAKNEVEQLISNLTAIQAVIAGAEKKQVHKATVRNWLENLKDVTYDIEDVLDDCEAAILRSQTKPRDEQVDPKPGRKVCSFMRSSCFCCKQVGLRYDIANKIKALNERVDLLNKEKERYRLREDREEMGLVERDVFEFLWLSYNDLSPVLKRCFSYCAIFPKDYKIEKRMLIELWMAQGYLMGRQSDDLEVIGEYYFQNLAMRSFFQDFEKDEYDNQSIQSCKIHDLFHDFAQFIARNDCLSVQEQEHYSEEMIRDVRHLCLDLPEHGSYLNLSHHLRNKRSLLWWSKPTTEELSSLLGELTRVRSLSLRDGDFEEIPTTISKLVQLRWLDLSGNLKLKKLPEILYELHKLETIDITNCINLELPPGIENLINLKHLHNFPGPSSGLPKGTAQLTGLRTLEEVDVCCDVDKFSLGDLKNLNQLCGSLIIKNLGAHRRHVGETKEAEFKKKEHLTRLELGFQSREGIEGEEEEHLLEALEPPPNLEILSIVLYRGTTFPGWMINSLTNLKHIVLVHCERCEHLPSLGKLPSLETLELYRMESVKKVGVELLGIETQISASSSSSSSSSPVVVAFPKLTKLEFYGMRNWEEWDDYYYNYNDGTTKPPSSITIMPSLRSLKIYGCKRLKALPDYIVQNTMLHTLVIKDCNLLVECYNKEKGEDWFKISHIPHVRIEHDIL